MSLWNGVVTWLQQLTGAPSGEPPEVNERQHQEPNDNAQCNEKHSSPLVGNDNRKNAREVAKVSTAEKPRERKREKKKEPPSALSVQTDSSAPGVKPAPSSDKGRNSKTASQHKAAKPGRHGTSTGVPPQIGDTVPDCSSQPEKKSTRSTETSLRNPGQKPATVKQTTKNSPIADTKSRSTDTWKNSTVSSKAAIRESQQQPLTKKSLPPLENPINSSQPAPNPSVLFQRQQNPDSVRDFSAGSNSLQGSTEVLPQKSNNPEQQCQLTIEDLPSLSSRESSQQPEKKSTRSTERSLQNPGQKPEKKSTRSTETSLQNPWQKPATVKKTTKNSPIADTKSRSTDTLKNSTISSKATIRDAQQQPLTKTSLPPLDNPINSCQQAPNPSVPFQRLKSQDSVLDSSAGSSSLQGSTEVLPQMSSNPEQQYQLTIEDPLSLSSRESFPSERTQGPRCYISDLDTGRLINEAKGIKHDLRLAGYVSGALKSFFEDEVKTLQEEKNVVSEAIKPLKDKITQSLNEAHSWNWDFLKSGSHYDGTKVARVDEMDFMLVPENFRGSLQLVEDKRLPPGFFFVRFHKSSLVKDGWIFKKMFCEDGLDRLVSAKLYRSHLFKILQGAVDNVRRAVRQQENTLEATTSDDSPSFVVEYQAIPEENGMRSVKLDLVLALPLRDLPAKVKENFKDSQEMKEFFREIQNDGCDVVPKCCKSLPPELEDRRDFVWRLSLSRAEKKLTRNFDSRLEDQEKRLTSSSRPLTPPPSPPSPPPKRLPSGRRPRPTTCRKQVLRYLKRLLELINGIDNSRPITARRRMADHQHQNAVAYQLLTAANHVRRYRNVQTKKFTTYQIRNLMWTKCYDLNRGIEKWKKTRVPERLRDMLIQLRKMVALEMRVGHFFITEMDMMSDVPREEREFLFIMFYIAEDLLCGRSD